MAENFFFKLHSKIRDTRQIYPVLIDSLPGHETKLGLEIVFVAFCSNPSCSYQSPPRATYDHACDDADGHTGTCA